MREGFRSHIRRQRISACGHWGLRTGRSPTIGRIRIQEATHPSLVLKATARIVGSALDTL